ncbi:ribonuclease Z [Fistulifera solaris]|uniref:ribonuclease Z n=1 Tax=Fistulifera solaris TaxID=1519565 RepID=A0A1Z5K3Z4_FISSO|nr:ribonuclease Z [Fistulifera solaris]|eukprot:GAX20967.1 ribonuclease Z [Fistulifera solaris]
MTACVRILSTSSPDSSPAILLVAPDGSKILVNCGEGCQRTFLENSQRLSTVTTICLTHIAHDSVGGLPGLILTSADASAVAIASQFATTGDQGNNDTKAKLETKQIQQKDTLNDETSGLDIIGPVGTQTFIHSLRHFMRREKFPLRVHEGLVTHQAENSNRQKRKRKRKSSEQEEDSFKFTVQSVAVEDEEGRQTLSYVFTSPPIPGKFLPQEAFKLGVPKGPLYAQLKAGKSVTFVDGASGVEKTVESHQVVMSPTPGIAIMMLSYRTLSCGDRLIGNDLLSDMVESNDLCVDLIVHIAPKSIFTELMASGKLWKRNEDCDVEIEHVLVPVEVDGYLAFPESEPTPFRSAAVGAYCRSLLCPQIYGHPLPMNLPSESESEVDSNSPLGYRLGRAMMEYQFIPRASKGFSVGLQGNSAAEADQIYFVNVSGASVLAKEIIGTDEQQDQTKSCLIFTGTGSAIPCKHRNVTGMFLRQSNGRGILLDVGEGTVGQLLRTQHISSSIELFQSVKAVWLSHPHADHHLGVLRLLHEKKKQLSTDGPVILIGPTPLFDFLNEYSKQDPSIENSFVKVDCRDLVHGQSSMLANVLERELGISSVRTVPVAHCAHSYAVVLDGTSFGRVVYSGDCRPSRQLAAAALGADVLIHEATFEDGMEAEAVLKRHSTVGEALNVARDMQAKCVVLTHFSQRYPRIPPTSSYEKDSIDSPSLKVVFAFDHMRLTPGNLGLAARITPAVRLLYPEDTENEVTNNVGEDVIDLLSTPGLFAHNKVL